MSTATLSPPVPALAAIEERLAGAEELGIQVCDAIKSLADALVEIQQRSAAPEPGQPPNAQAANEIVALGARVRQLEQQLRVQAINDDLARVSRFHQKRPSVVFVGTTYFGCNAKYGWLGFREGARADGIDCWFLPQTEAQQAIVEALGEACFPVDPQHWTPAHLTAALSAAVVVTCDHLLNPNPFAAALLAGARHVQLWHGISIKEIGLGNLRPLRDLSPHVARVMATCGPFTRFIGTSTSQRSEFRRWFGFDDYAPIGYPRNDVLLRAPTEADLLGVDVEALHRARASREAGRRVILYAPTFRDAQRGSWILGAGLERIAAALAKAGDTLLVALHPVEGPLVDTLKTAVPSARFVTPRTDLYPLLREVDLLVTDYSSIMFDFLLLDRPVVLYRPDHDDYLKRSRQLYDTKLLDAKPGPTVTSAEGLLKVLRRRDGGAVDHAGDRAALREKLFDHPDGQASERLNALLRAELRHALDD